MISRGRTLAGALVLCALAGCGFAAANASALGLTAVACEEVSAGIGSYNSSHCETPKSPGNYETAAIPVGTPTSVAATSTVEEPALRATIGGVNLTVRCETGHVIEGSLQNEEPTPGATRISSTATRVTYTNCHALLKSNEARFCAVEEVTGPDAGAIGMISTTALKGATTSVNHQVKVEPKEGELLTKFNILKKGSKPATESECYFNNNVPVEVKGSVEGEANTAKHSHLTFTEANNGSNLKIGGISVKYLDTVGASMTGEPEITVGAETFDSGCLGS